MVTWRRPPSGFQSTLPVRGATLTLMGGSSATAISIHAPREGSDRKNLHYIATTHDFNPRSP